MIREKKKNSYGLDFMKERHERKTLFKGSNYGQEGAKALINREEEGRLPPTLA